MDPRVHIQGNDWNWKRNGVADRRRRRIQERSAEYFPLLHGNNLCPERTLSGLPNHGSLKENVTLRGVKCTGAPAYTGPREVSRDPRMRNGHHHYWTNYQTSVNPPNAPPRVNIDQGSWRDQNQIYEGQHVSLRPVTWEGSRPGSVNWDNRLITPCRVMAKRNYTFTPGLKSRYQIKTGYSQPLAHPYRKESVPNTDWLGRVLTDTTKDNNNGRVVPLRSDGFDTASIRYINSNGLRHPVERTARQKAFTQQDRRDQWKSFQCVPMDLNNPWGQKRHTHGNDIMEGNWNRSDSYVGFAETNNHDSKVGSTTNSADNNMFKQVASVQTIRSHSNQHLNEHSAEKENQMKPNSTPDLCPIIRGSAEIKDSDCRQKDETHQVRVIHPDAAVSFILPRTNHQGWPIESNTKDTEDLLLGNSKENRGSGRTSISVLREGPGNKGPQWRKLHTDQTVGNLFNVRSTLSPETKSVEKTEKWKTAWPYKTLNPNAKSFYPSSVELTMMTDIESGELKGGKKPKAEEGKESPMVWNLKGRSIDDILVDLEALKNDPDIPMPIIEADIATAEDFEQYTRALKDEDCWENGKNDEISLDLECLEKLKLLIGPGHDKDRPEAFPVDLWPFVFNEQKPLIKTRWEGYDTEALPKLIEQFLSELKVSDERLYAKPYFVAQALANLDRFVVKSKDGVPPLIHEKFTHRMELLPGVRPRKELPQRFSETQNAFLRAKLSILEEQGRIKQKEGLKKEDWLHRLVLVEHPTRMAAFRLKHGDDAQKAMNDLTNRYEVSQLYRLTLDCREINKGLAIEPYPMPDNSMGKEHIIGSRYLSTSDAADAFYAVPIREEDYGKTGFTAIGKQWAFTVMLQGGINSARHFARIITETFDGVPQSKILAFQDDALAHAKRLLQALLNQQLLYDRIRINEIMLKPSKTRIGFSSCKFLGHIYTPMGRLPDPGRVECIVNMDAKPKTQKEVRHIVGLLVWNIEYIPNGMGILSYLSDLVRKDADVVKGWKPEVQGKALDLLKAALATAPCLKPIDVTRPFRVHVDACKNGRGIGAVLLQEYDDKWRPCSYFSKALTPAQRQWSATELEAYALVSAARHWERYLQNGHKWTAIVDHKALIYLVVKRTRTNNTRLLNSVMCLQGHHFDILHRNGEEHFDADAVSRILHSGDIQEAQEAVDIEDDYDKEVTMKDIRLLNRLLQLQYLAIANARGDPEVHMPMNTDHTPGKRGMTIFNRILKRVIPNQGETKEQDQTSPIIVETNMALTNKEARLEARNIRREAGLIEAQKKAKERREQLAKLRQEKLAAQALANASVSPISNNGSISEIELHQTPTPLEEDVDEAITYPNPEEESNSQQEDMIEPDDEEDIDPSRILIQTGPYRWTPTLIKEYMADYQSLEGKMLLHPRTGRLYEVGTVFFYDKQKIAAAYIKVIDGGQADPLDCHPHRIDGRGGLADLVASFEKSGGSSGSSRTPWPNSEEEWLSAQKQDPMWRELIEDMEREMEEIRQKRHSDIGHSSSSSSLDIRNDPTHMSSDTELVVKRTHRGMDLMFDHVLMVSRSNYDGNPEKNLYLVPESLKRNVMELYHDSKGHPGAGRTKETIYLTYWWKGMNADVENHIKSCKSCARRKARNAVAAVPIQGYQAPTMPWERTHIDLTGPLTTTTLGNRYIVVMKDALTRYVETMAIKDKTADMVVDAFIQCVVYRHGAVGTLVSDNGREFVNKLFAQVAQLLKIKHHTITEYNPRANGLAENHMRTMKDALSIYCDESQKDWDLHLNGVSASYNTTINSQTGFTPFFMLYGREARLPSEMWLRNFGKTTGVLPYINNLVKALTNVWDAAASTKPVELQRMREGQKPIRHLQFAEYKVGDYAMIANTPKSQNIGWVDAKFRKLNLKLQPRYSGPYLISKRLSPVVYVLQVDGFDMNVHATNMKPFTGRKTSTTPYAEPGMDIYQANERVVSEPLLLSPDSNLNEKARVKFRKKNIARQKDHSEEVNARQSREQRSQEMRDRLSASQDSLVIEEDLIFSDQYISPSFLNSTSSSNQDHTMNEETNTTEMREDLEPTTPQWELDFKQRTTLGLAKWEKNREGKRVRFQNLERPATKDPNPTKVRNIPSSLTSQKPAQDIYRYDKSRYSCRPLGITSARHTKVSAIGQRDVHSLKKHINPYLTPNPITDRLRTHSRPIKRSSKPDEKTSHVEECNLAGGEKWEQHIGSTFVDLVQDGEESESDSTAGSISSEDSFDRERWHRSVLKACANHASKLNLSTYEPIIFGFDNKETHKLRVELDAEIQIPIELRRVWYQVHLEVRHFGKTGLLFPITNVMLEPRDHWRNNSRSHLRHTPLSIYSRILTLPMSVMKTMFHPQCQGKITLSTDTGNSQTTILGVRSVIQHKYDQWYWNAMRIARRMDIDPSSPRRAYTKLRGYGRKEGLAMNGPEWRAHHFFMWDAIERNKSLREPPLWFKEIIPRC